MYCLSVPLEMESSAKVDSSESRWSDQLVRHVDVFIARQLLHTLFGWSCAGVEGRQLTGWCWGWIQPALSLTLSCSCVLLCC